MDFTNHAYNKNAAEISKLSMQSVIAKHIIEKGGIYMIRIFEKWIASSHAGSLMINLIFADALTPFHR